MKTFSLSKILNNDYLKLILLLILCYTLSHSTFKVVSRVDYIIILYAFFLNKITDDNIVQYSIIFGLFYDYQLGSLIGVNVLLFLALSLIYLRYSTTFKSSNQIMQFASIAVIFFIFVLYNAIYLDYSFTAGAISVIKNFVIDILLYLFCYFVLELIGAIPIFKR